MTKTLTAVDLEKSADFTMDLRGSDYRYVRAGSRLFCRTVGRLDDGRFYGFILKDGKVILARGFRMKKDAKGWRDGLYLKRRQAIDRIKAGKGSVQHTKKDLLEKKVRDAKQHIKYLNSRIARLQTYLKKAKRRLVGLQVALSRVGKEEI